MRTEVIRSDPYLDDPDYLSPWLEPTYVPGPDEGHVYFGANPAWSPACESPPPNGDACPRCGSTGFSFFLLPGIGPGHVGHWHHARGRIEAGTDDICAACLRWGRDDRLARILLREFAWRGSNEPMPRPVVEARAEERAARGASPSPRIARFLVEDGGLRRLDSPA